jgi:hypothetical protein
MDDTRGLNIPFYILTFGISGGFLRYLYKTAGKEYEHNGSPPINSATVFVHQTLGELANVLLSPLLAIAVWFILSQGDARTNVYIMAALSFIVGLITEEVIHSLILFAKGRLKEIGDKEIGEDKRKLRQREEDGT